jgi:hypothetical protein
MEVMLKSQNVRLLDVFAIGPLMIYGGMKLRQTGDHSLAGSLLALFGVTTILYNGRNYVRYLEGA